MDSNWWFGPNSLWGKATGGGSPSSSWWFGDNSLYAQTGVRELFTGAEGGSDNGIWGDFAVPTEIDLSPDLKLGITVVVGLMAFKILMK